MAIFAVGLASGLLFDLARILSFFSGNDKYSKGLFDFLAVVFSFGLLFYCNLAVNYGQFRLYVVVTFLFAILLERVLSKFLWTKCIKRCYNNFKEKTNAKKKKKEKNK